MKKCIYHGYSFSHARIKHMDDTPAMSLPVFSLAASEAPALPFAALSSAGYGLADLLPVLALSLSRCDSVPLLSLPR